MREMTLKSMCGGDTFYCLGARRVCIWVSFVCVGVLLLLFCLFVVVFVCVCCLPNALLC